MRSLIRLTPFAIDVNLCACYNVIKLTLSCLRLKTKKNCNLKEGFMDPISISLPCDAWCVILDEVDALHLRTLRCVSKALEAYVNSYRLIQAAKSRCFTDLGIENVPAFVNRNKEKLICITLSQNIEDFTLGSIATLSNFTTLTTLDLDACHKITDIALRHIGALATIEELFLIDCVNFTDDGLKLLRPLSNLTDFHLSNAEQITDGGIEHLSSFTNLTCLALDYSPLITDEGLKALSPLTKLVNLSLCNANQITDAGLKTLASLAAMQFLGLNYCHEVTDEGLAHLKVFTNLTDLNLQGCNKITDNGLEHLGAHSALSCLNLACDHITDGGLDHLSSLTNLEDLVLGHGLSYGAFFQGHGPLYNGLNLFGTLSQLRRLDLAIVHISATTFKLLKSLSHLEDLSLACSGAITDDALAHLNGFSQLTKLHLLNCRATTDEGLKHLSTLSNLVNLKLMRFEQISEGLNNLSSLIHLQELWLACCNLANSRMLSGFSALSKLKTLYINTHATSLTGEGLKYLSSLSNLEYLSLSYSKITDDGLKHLCTLTHLKTLHLAHNAITDLGLKHLSALPNLTFLDLQGCQITDNGLEHLSSLTGLEILLTAQATP